MSSQVSSFPLCNYDMEIKLIKIEYQAFNQLKHFIFQKQKLTNMRAQYFLLYWLFYFDTSPAK